jgi:hypothetical protein
MVGNEFSKTRLCSASIFTAVIDRREAVFKQFSSLKVKDIEYEDISFLVLHKFFIYFINTECQSQLKLSGKCFVNKAYT